MEWSVGPSFLHSTIDLHFDSSPRSCTRDISSLMLSEEGTQKQRSYLPHISFDPPVKAHCRSETGYMMGPLSLII